MAKAFKCENCGKLQSGTGISQLRVNDPSGMLDKCIIEDYIIEDVCDVCLEKYLPCITITWLRYKE